MPVAVSKELFREGLAMAGLQVMAPILPGKFDQWKEFHDTIVKGGKNEEGWKAQQRRYGIQRQYGSFRRRPWVTS
jgi:hypothetical protein